MNYICNTCRKAGRNVLVEPAEFGPTERDVHKAHQGFGVGLGNHHVEDLIPETDTLDGFLRVYAPNNRERVVLDLDMEDKREHSPFVIVRHKGRVLILNPMAFDDHLCVDVHAFVNGADARTGVFGMDAGKRVRFPKDEVKGTSHGWPAAALVALLLGKQEES